MSVKVMAHIWDLQRSGTIKLNPGELNVALAMADHADHDGTNIYPSLPMIAEKVGMTRRGVQKIVRRLEEKGLLVATQKSAQHRPTKYRIPMPDANNVRPSDANVVRPCKSPDANEKTSRREHGDAQTRTPVRPNHQEPSEPSIESYVISNSLPPPSEVMKSWNDFASRNGLSPIRKVTAARAEAIRKRRAEIWPNIEAIYAQIEASGFLLGGGKTGWRIDFDFLWGRADAATKILEGKYDNGKSTQRRIEQDYPDQFAA